jgi:hypothetical protein
MHRSGWLTLIKTTLAAIPVYVSINIGLPLSIEGVREDYESIPLDWYRGSARGQVSHPMEQDLEVITPGWTGNHGLEATGHGIAATVALAAAN